jgi:protoheme IX farnesyltransferase
MGSGNDLERRVYIESVGVQYSLTGIPRSIPNRVLALLRLCKPGIVAAVLVEGFTGLVLGERGWPDGKAAFICLSALLLSASGSAIINGLLDASIDLRMLRLRKRSEAMECAGRWTMLAVALSAIIAALFLSLRFLGIKVFCLISVAVVSYSLLYTLRLKRRSPWGAVSGGIPGALPVLIGYLSASQALRMDGIILFVFMLLWQPPHFWSLALDYREEYQIAGLPVLPVSHGEGFTKYLIFIYAIALLPVSLSLWVFGFCSPWYAGSAFILGLSFLTVCWISLIRARKSGWVFRASIFYLILLLTAIVVDVSFINMH